MLALRKGSPIRDTSTTPWPSWPLWGDDEHKGLTSVLNSGIWSYNGPKEGECLSHLHSYFNNSLPILVSNGTVSLQLALEALDIGYGDEVLVPGLTWQATAAAVLDVNAVPVLVDVDSHSWCIDIDKAEAAITAKTKAIIPVHLYGCIANMDEIKKLATRKNLFVIEDASHVHGSEYNGEKVGTLGNIGSFSLQMSKILTCGEGGILLTKDEALWQRLDALRNCGRKRDNFIVDATGGLYGEEGDFIQSGNYRITEFQAAVLVGQLSRLDEQNRIRENNASLLDDLLRSLPGLRTMQRDDRETKRSFFNYSFMYDEKEVGIPTSVMREALSAELGLPFGPSYQPLNNCSLYRPLTKKRHSISIEYFKKINPLKYELPVCEDIYTNTSVVFHHKYLLGPSDDMYMLKEAYQKIIDNKKELLSFTKKE